MHTRAAIQLIVAAVVVENFNHGCRDRGSGAASQSRRPRFRRLPRLFCIFLAQSSIAGTVESMSESKGNRWQKSRRPAESDTAWRSVRCGEFFILVNGRPRKVSRAEWLDWARSVIENRRLGAWNQVDRTLVGVYKVVTHFTGKSPTSLYATRVIKCDDRERGVARYYAHLGDAKQGHWQVVDELRAVRAPEAVELE